MGVVDQWLSTGTESQRPWAQFLAAPPFFPALVAFQKSTDSNGKIRPLIRPWLIGPDHRTPCCDSAQDVLYNQHISYYFVYTMVLKDGRNIHNCATDSYTLQGAKLCSTAILMSVHFLHCHFSCNNH